MRPTSRRPRPRLLSVAGNCGPGRDKMGTGRPEGRGQWIPPLSGRVSACAAQLDRWGPSISATYPAAYERGTKDSMTNTSPMASRQSLPQSEPCGPWAGTPGHAQILY